jgi:hypothetical protein
MSQMSQMSQMSGGSHGDRNTAGRYPGKPVPRGTVFFLSQRISPAIAVAASRGLISPLRFSAREVSSKMGGG